MAWLREAKLKQIRPVRARKVYTLGDVCARADKVFPEIHETLHAKYKKIRDNKSIHQTPRGIAVAFRNNYDKEAITLPTNETLYDSVSSLGHETAHHIFGLKDTLPSEIMPVVTELLIKRNEKDNRIRIMTTADDFLSGYSETQFLSGAPSNNSIYFIGSMASAPLADLITSKKLCYTDLLHFKKGYREIGQSQKDNDRLTDQLCDMGATPDVTLASVQNLFAREQR